MARFVSKEKLSKRARKAQNDLRRETWGSISPVTRKVESKKAYKRVKPSNWYNDDSLRVSSFSLRCSLPKVAGNIRLQIAMRGTAARISR